MAAMHSFLPRAPDAAASFTGGRRNLLSSGGEDAAFTFEDVLFMMITLLSLWLSGRFFKTIGSPALVGEIVMGIVVGPHLTNIAPKPEALMLVGEVGLLLLVLEAGLDVDLEMIRKTGARAVAVAVSGSMVPLAIGTGIASAMGLSWKSALVVGVVLSPTSVGIALNVLNSAKILATETGQLIIAAAILDDIIALVLLSELEALEHPSAWAFVKPLLVALLLFLGVGAFAVLVVPKILKRALPSIPEAHRENFLLFLIFAAAIGMIPGVHYAGGSHLLGAFLAGLCFCTDHHVHHAWIRQVKRVMHWLLTIFFACTIGFEIPITQLFTAKVMKTAAAYFVAIAGKVATGFWATPLTRLSFFTVGFSMSAWGEFAFVVASAAQAQHLIDSDTFSSCILCVLLSVIFGPTLLRLTLSFKPDTEKEKQEKGERERFCSDGRKRANSSMYCAKETTEERYPVFYILCVKCQGRPGQQACILRVLQQLDLEIFDARVYHPKGQGDALAYKESAWYNSSQSNQLLSDVVVKDPVLFLPLSLQSDFDFNLWSSRYDEIMDRMQEAVEDSTAVIELERFQPGLIDGHFVEDYAALPEGAGDRAPSGESQGGEGLKKVETFRRSIDFLRNSMESFRRSLDGARDKSSKLADNNGPSLPTIYAHADLELRARVSARDEHAGEYSLKRHGAELASYSDVAAQLARRRGRVLVPSTIREQPGRKATAAERGGGGGGVRGGGGWGGVRTGWGARRAGGYERRGATTAAACS